MANAKHKNTIYVDSTGDFTVSATLPILYGIIVTPSADDCVLVIKESSSSGTVKVYLKIVSTETRFCDFSRPDGGGIELTPTFNITTLTNITCAILIGAWGSPIGRARG